MNSASDILQKLESIDGRVVQPVITNSGIRFTIYNLTDLDSIEQWVTIARECKEQLGAKIDTCGVYSEANLRIWVPEENIEFDVEEGDQTVSTGYN